MGSPSESLVYEFYVRTQYVGSDSTEEIDLIAEGWVDSLEEWGGMTEVAQIELLSEVLNEFVGNEIESGWTEVE